MVHVPADEINRASVKPAPSTAAAAGGEAAPKNVKSNEKPAAGPEIEKNIKSEDVAKAVEVLNERIKPKNFRASFSLDEATNRVIIQIINNETDEVIRQIPPEELLNLSRRLDEAIGLMFNVSA